MSSADARPRASRIDPRLRARRIAIRRDLGRRRLRRLVMVAGTSAVVGLAWALTLSPVLDVDRVAVRGAAHTGPTEVAAASGVDLGDALLYVDLAEVREHVQTLPWVASADVTRRWPGTLQVTVVERAAAGVLPARGGGWAVADAHGHVLEVAAERPAGLPVIQGGGFAGAPGERAPDTAAGALRVASALSPSLRERVGAVGRAGDGTLELEVVLGEGHVATARFGPPEQVRAKLVALATLLADADLANVTLIDLRVPGVPTVTRG